MYRYFKLRDLAWQILINSKVDSLPIDLNKVLNYLDLKALQYDFKDIDDRGASAIINNQQCILYSNTCDEQQARFTISHEIGHILLQHYDIDNDDIEKEANSFAARLLMPLGVLNAIGISKAEDIATVCNVSLESADWRAKRMQEVAKRNKYGASDLERQLIQQFSNFIEEFKKGK